MIKVVNKSNYSGPGEPIHRPYPLGNPFSHLESTLAEFKVATRYDAIMAFVPWLKEKLKTENEVKAEFDRLVKIYKNTNELILICFCAPKPCHGLQIKKMIEEYEI